MIRIQTNQRLPVPHSKATQHYIKISTRKRPIFFTCIQPKSKEQAFRSEKIEKNVDNTHIFSSTTHNNPINRKEADLEKTHFTKASIPIKSKPYSRQTHIRPPPAFPKCPRSKLSPKTLHSKIPKLQTRTNQSGNQGKDQSFQQIQIKPSIFIQPRFQPQSE